MKIYTPEISWHNRDPIFGVDIQKHIENDGDKKFYRFATCGSDNVVAIWRAYLNNQQQTFSKSKNFNQIDNQIHLAKNNQSEPVSNQQFEKTSMIKDQIDKNISEVLNNLVDRTASAFDLDDKNDNDQNMKVVELIEKPKENKLIDLKVVCTLGLHIKAVNVAKFAPISNLIASGSDDAYVYIYEYQDSNKSNCKSDKDICNPFSESDEQISIENWKRIITLRRHLNDIVDLAWSPDEKYLITGSVDNLSFVWDARKGEALYELPKHSGYVQGVAWDPLNNYIVTLCTDRNLRIFNASSEKGNKKQFPITKLNKQKLNVTDENCKNSSLFYDDTLATISRRMCFSQNGELLACPSGIIELDDGDDDNSNTFINCLHLFYRKDNFKKLHCYLPTGVYTNSVSFCQKLFKLNADIPNPYPFPYRLVFAIACKDKILIYDTQQPFPIAKISDIHYTRLSDLSWSIDGRILIASSTDGYCTIVYFNENELGEKYEGEPYKFETVEAKKQTSSSSITSKKVKANIDEIVTNENFSAEKTSQHKTITSYFKKTNPTPLSTKLSNSFEKISDKTTNNSNENPEDLIKAVESKDDDQAQQFLKSPISALIENIINPKSITTNILQVKRNPTLVQNTISKDHSLTNETQFSHLNNQHLPAQKISLSPSNNNNEAIRVPCKRNAEQTPDQQGNKKKKVDFITLS